MFKWIKSHWLVYTTFRVWLVASAIAVVVELVEAFVFHASVQTMETSVVMIYWLSLSFFVIHILFDEPRYARQRWSVMRDIRQSNYALFVGVPKAAVKAVKRISHR